MGTGSGNNVPTTAYFGGEDMGTAIDHVEARISGTQAQFFVYPKMQLAAGEYTGTLKLSMCADRQCSEHFKGSPVNVAYTVSVGKGLKVTPGSVDLSSLTGASASVPVAVQLPGGVSSFSAATSAAWLQVANITSSGMTIIAGAKGPGLYNGLVTVSAGSRTVTVPVTYRVTADPSSVSSITPDRASLDFSAPTGYASSGQQLKVTLPNWAQGLSTSVQYRTGDAGWLVVTPGAGGAVSVVASAANLRPGAYRADLVLSGGTELAPVSVPVTLNVLAADWSVTGTSTLTVDAASTTSTMGGQISIDVPNLPVQGWQASSNATWLQLSRSSGSLRTDKLGVSVNVAQMLKLANFHTYTADITLSLASGKTAGTKFTVTLDKRLPELSYISPHTRLSGEAGNYIVRGRGFDAITNLNQVLQVKGATPAQIVRVNDTQFELSLPAAQGDATVALSNTLGASSGSVTLKTVSQPAFTYAAVAAQGNKGGLVFDPERQALFTVNKTLGSLMRFSKSGNNWNVSSAPVSSVDEVAISPDGKSLIVTVTSGQIKLFDPATLTEQGSFKAGGVYGETLNSLPRMAVRNDGKVLFSGASGVQDDGGYMPYFDLVSRSFGNIGGAYVFGWASVSGDGSHINIVQSASYTPLPPIVSLDGRDQVAKPAPSGLGHWFESAQSLRGERFAEGTYKVWDHDFNVIGKVAIPDSTYFGRTPVFSPDGKRLYVMAYDSNGLYVGSTSKPRVYVFDSSTRMVTSTDLPLLGYFELADYPTCAVSSYECDTRALGTISPDGKTLFFLGDARLIVAPIPAVLVGRQAAAMRRLVLPASR
ncbi:PD40 domain-containing protein [Duganella aquatilis]|nr:PD40 domain-containing protein [Duganella aquatilis]